MFRPAVVAWCILFLISILCILCVTSTKLCPAQGVKALKYHHDNQGCNLPQSIRNSYTCICTFPFQKIIHPRNVSYSVKRATGRCSQQHNFESRVRLSHLPGTCLKRGNISSLTFVFPFTPTHMKRQGIVRVPDGPFRYPINYFLLCFSTVAYRGGGVGGSNPPPPEITKYWQSRTGLQIEQKMFSVPISTS